MRRTIVAEIIADSIFCRCLNLKGDYTGSNCDGFSHGLVNRNDLKEPKASGSESRIEGQKSTE